MVFVETKEKCNLMLVHHFKIVNLNDGGMSSIDFVDWRLIYDLMVAWLFEAAKLAKT